MTCPVVSSYVFFLAYVSQTWGLESQLSGNAYEQGGKYIPMRPVLLNQGAKEGTP